MEKDMILKRLGEIAKEISGADATLEFNTDIPTTLGMDSFLMALFFCTVEERFGVAIHDYHQCCNTTALIEAIQGGRTLCTANP